MNVGIVPSFVRMDIPTFDVNYHHDPHTKDIERETM